MSEQVLVTVTPIVVGVTQVNPKVTVEPQTIDTVVVAEKSVPEVTVTEQIFEVTVQQPSPTSVTIETRGVQGVPGIGVPSGGLTGQVLLKLSNTDYDTGWLDLDMFANYKTQEVDDAGSTTYVGKSNARSGAWLIERIVDTSGDLTSRYANVSNNGAYVTFAAAWTARASLVYAEINTLTGI